MNAIVETVMIETKNGPVRINESDYDKTQHKLVGEKKPVVETDGFDRQAALKTLKEAGIEVSKNAKNEKLQELLSQLPKKNFEVQPKDDKFIIVDADGVQMGENLFETEQSAEEMISLLEG